MINEKTPPPEGERAAFEAWYSEGGKWPMERDTRGNYKLAQAGTAWTVWQARAALAAPGEAPPSPLDLEAAEGVIWDLISELHHLEQGDEEAAADAVKVAVEKVLGLRAALPLGAPGKGMEEPSLGVAYDGSPMDLAWFIRSLEHIARPVDSNESGHARVMSLRHFIEALKAARSDAPKPKAEGSTPESPFDREPIAPGDYRYYTPNSPEAGASQEGGADA